MRLKNTNGLFGSEGKEDVEIKCSWCGIEYKETRDCPEPEKIKDDICDDCETACGPIPVFYDQIGKIIICSNCYEAFERAILLRMKEILPWFTSLLKWKLEEVKKYNELLQEVPIDFDFEKSRFNFLEME